MGQFAQDGKKVQYLSIFCEHSQVNNYLKILSRDNFKGTIESLSAITPWKKYIFPTILPSRGKKFSVFMVKFLEI